MYTMVKRLALNQDGISNCCCVVAEVWELCVVCVRVKELVRARVGRMTYPASLTCFLLLFLSAKRGQRVWTINKPAFVVPVRLR